MFEVKIEGLREVDAALSALPLAVQKRTMTTALMRAGEVIAREARRMAPVDEGFLRESINVTDKRPDHLNVGGQAYALAMQEGFTSGEAGQVARAANRAVRGTNFQAEVWVGPSKRAASAWPQELGTINHPAHPFLRPAFDATRARVAETLAFELFDLVQRAAARHAARTTKAG